MPHGVMFHHFCGDRHAHIQGALTQSELAAMIEWIGVDRFLPASEWQARARTGRLRERDLCLTFDDALRCQYDLALPVLDQFGLSGFWFIYSSVFEGVLETLEVDRYFRNTQFASIDEFYAAFDEQLESMDFAEEAARALADFIPANYLAEYAFYSDGDRRFRYLRDYVLGPARYRQVMDRMLAGAGFEASRLRSLLWMDNECLADLEKRGHVIGLHSYSHPTLLSQLPPAEQRAEYQRNFSHLAATLGRPVRSMSHPCNSYDDHTLEILRDLGIEIGFRADMELSFRSTLELPREDHSLVAARMRAS